MNNENVKIAKRAFDFCQKELENENYELALTYLLNAISHHSDLEYLQKYPEILNKISSEERNIYGEQAINLYSIALYNNPPEDVEEILEGLETIRAIMTDSENKDSSDTEETNIAHTFAAFEQEASEYAWKNLISSEKIEDINILTARLNFYNSVIQYGENVSSNMLSAPQRHSLQCAPQQLQDTKTLLEYVGIKRSVLQYLNEAELEIRKRNYNAQYIFCRLQQVNTLLAQLWLFDVTQIIGREIFLAQLNKLQDDYNNLEKDFLEKESAPLCKKIKTDIESAIKESEKNSQSKRSYLIEDLQERYNEIAERISTLPLREKKLEMQKELQKIVARINDLSKERYARYQKKCAEICRTAIQNFEDKTFVFEKDAQQIFNNAEICTINEALISPETATILQMTKQMLEEKFSLLNKADFAVKCVEASKMSLEDF